MSAQPRIAARRRRSSRKYHSGTRFERTLLSEMRRGDGQERFDLPEAAMARLRSALEQDLAAPDPMKALVRALQLTTSFDLQLASPSIAARLRALLRGDQSAMEILRTAMFASPPADDELHTYVRREGRDEVLCVPQVPEPPRSVTLRTLIDPNAAPRERRHRDRVREPR